MKKERLIEEARESYRSYLKKRSMFYTGERDWILNCVLHSRDHFSADEMYLEIQTSKKKVSRSTVFRSLRQLVQCGVLIEADFGHGHAHYELALGAKLHIHLIDTESGTIKEASSEEVDLLMEKIAKKKNFELHHHKIQLFGKFKN